MKNVINCAVQQNLISDQRKEVEIWEKNSADGRDKK